VSRGLLSVLATGMTFYWTQRLDLSVGALAVAWAAVFIWFDLPAARGLILPADKISLLPLITPATQRLWHEAIPLGLVAFLVALQGQMPRYVVGARLGAMELGQFAAANYLTFVGTVMVVALSAPAAVRLAQHHTRGEVTAFVRLLLKLLAVGGAIGLAGVCVAAAAGSWILEVVYGAEYASMATLLVWLTAAAGVSYIASFCVCAMTACGAFGEQLPLFLAVAVTTGAACYLLTPHFGVIGAALGLLVGNTVQLLLSVWIIARGLRLGHVGSWHVPAREVAR
jgi:O-antigen/teichoic acid export membrane protein